MFKVATNGGFITYDFETRVYDTHPDSRMATPFASFNEADAHGKNAVRLLFGPVNQYYEIMISATALTVARRSYQKEIDEATT